MDNILSWSKEINLRFYKETTMLQAHEFLSSDRLMTPTPLARKAISKLPAHIGAITLRSDALCDSTLWGPLHWACQYRNIQSLPVSSLFSYTLCATPLLWALYQYFRHFLYVPHSWTSMCQTNRNFRRHDTISSHISSKSHDICTGRQFIQQDPVRECPNRCP